MKKLFIFLLLILPSLGYSLDNLNGEWRFYWNQLLTKTDAKKDTNFALQPVPYHWSFYKQNYPINGYATYSREYRIKDHNIDQVYGVYISYMEHSYNFYINGQLLESMGKVGTNEQTFVPAKIGKTFFFRSSSNIINITTQVSSFGNSVKTSGLWTTIRIGSSEEILRLRESLIIKNVIMITLLLSVGIYHFLLFLYRRKEKSFLYFSLMATAIAIRFLVTDDCLLTWFIPNFPFDIMMRIENLSILSFPILSILFFKAIYKYPLTDLDKIFLACLTLLSSITAFFPLSIYTLFIPLNLFSILFIGGYCIYINVTSIKRGKRNSLLLLYAFAMFYILALNDAAYFLGFINTFYVSPYGMILMTITQTIVLAKAFNESKEEAFTDHLTGILNRRGVLDKLVGKNFHEPQGVYMIDIDHFKKCNDEYGHDFGDKVIQHVAKCLSSTIRPTDIIGRFGGEEFIVIVNRKKDKSINYETIGERLRASVENDFVKHDSKIRITISVGLHERPDYEPFDIALNLADEALYEAKKTGRNKVCKK